MRAPRPRPGDLANTLNFGGNPANIFVGLSIAVPALLGLFWGAPMVAREIETGTSQFAWVQSVTRVRWLAVNTSWLLIAPPSGGVPSPDSSPGGPARRTQLARTGSSPTYSTCRASFRSATHSSRWHSGSPSARSCAARCQRWRSHSAASSPIRIVIASFLRPHYMHALTLTQRIGATMVPKGAYWQLTTGIVNAAGATLPRTGDRLIGLGNVTFSVSAIPAACQRLVGTGPPQPVVSCLNAHGLRQT